MKRLTLLILIIAVIIAVFLFGRSFWVPVMQKITGKKTTADVIALYGERARRDLRSYFSKANIPYPPRKIALLAMKQEQKLELWASNDQGKEVFIREYDIQKLSGNLGPKLREGDRQVPEGVYKIIGLNPNSAYHLSMKLNYPNDFDLQFAEIEGRTQPGSNIFIHGKAVSIGCLAMGDKTIEELFVLVNDTGMENVSVVISPYDPRKRKLQVAEETSADWMHALYLGIQDTFDNYRKP